MSETHIVDRIHKLSVGIGLFEPAVIGVIRKDLVTNVQENLRVELSHNSLSLFNMNTLKAILIVSAWKSVGFDRNTLICTPPYKRIRDHSRIVTPGVNEGVFSPRRGKISSFAKWMGNIEPLDTSVHGSATQERNSDFSCIEKLGVNSLPDKIVADLCPSIWVILANSVLSKSPKFKILGLLTFDATDIRILDLSPSTRKKSLNGTWKDNFRDARLGYTHDFETMSETTVYFNHIRNNEL